MLWMWFFIVAAERPPKKEEPFREDRRRLDPTGPSARGGHPMPRSGPGNRAANSMHPPPTAMGPPGSHGGSGSHKDIKLTLLTKVTNSSVRTVPVSWSTHGPGSGLCVCTWQFHWIVFSTSALLLFADCFSFTISLSFKFFLSETWYNRFIFSQIFSTTFSHCLSLCIDCVGLVLAAG